MDRFHSSSPFSPYHDYSLLRNQQDSGSSFHSHDPCNLLTLEADGSSHMDTLETTPFFLNIKPGFLSSQTLRNIISDSSYMEEVDALTQNGRVESYGVEPKPFQSKNPHNMPGMGHPMGNDPPPRLRLVDDGVVQARYPGLTRKEIQKAAYNFGQAAIGNHMMKKIRQGEYNSFMSGTMGRDEEFINSLMSWSISYKRKRDFKRVWNRRYRRFLINKPSHLEHNRNVALRRITKKFLGADAVKWINYNIRREDYQKLYFDILHVYRRGIRDVRRFSLREFSSSTR